MQVTVESPNRLERQVTVIVPNDKFEAAFDKKIKSLAKTAKVNGFRPGKVPLQVIKQRFGDSVRNETLSDVIQTSLYAAIEQENLKPIDIPKVEPKVLAHGQPIEFVARFEVMPELDQVNFDVKEIEKQMATLQDSDVNKVVERLREQHIRWIKVDRAAQERDQVYIDFVGSIDGKVFENGKAHDYPIIIGSKMMIPGFEEGLIGTTVGETKILDITFPADYFAKDVAGKAAQFEVKVLRIMEPELPELTDNFVKKLGIKSGKLEDLHEEIKENLNRELNRMMKTKLKTTVFEKLVEQNPMDVPQSLIEREAKRIHDQVHPHQPGEEHHHTEAEMQTFKDAAKRNVAIGLMVSALVKKYDIAVNRERVQSYIANLASAYEKPEDVINWYTKDKRKYAEIELQVLEEQVLEKLLEGIEIKEKPVTYSELMKNS